MRREKMRGKLWGKVGGQEAVKQTDAGERDRAR